METDRPTGRVAPERPCRGPAHGMMGPRLRPAGMTVDWRFIRTPPFSGEENMRLDAEGLERVGKGLESPVLRFFRFRNPTLSYGRLQKLEDILPLVPPAWDSIQRPTGGGIVFHDGDLCFSLCWKNGQAPLPRRPQEQYRWIHTIVLAGLAGDVQARMAACGDVALPREPFAIRTCFQNPVGYDLLKDEDKIVGGALRCTRQATLYQGSLQIPVSASLQASLQAAFLKHLAVP